MPWAMTGSKLLPSSDLGLVSAGTANMAAWLGPYISASNTPTRLPLAAIAMARLAVTVDLPTPPLPDATAIICFTPSVTLFSSQGLYCTS